MLSKNNSKVFKLGVVFLLGLALTASASAFAGGDGSESDPYQIESCQGLQDMDNDKSAFYELVSDVDCSGFTYQPVGEWAGETNGEKGFLGSLQGNQHVISNIDYTNADDKGYALFKQIGSSSTQAEIHNFTIENWDAKDSTHRGSACVAGNLVNANVSNIRCNDGVSQTTYQAGVFFGIQGYYGNAQQSYLSESTGDNTDVFAESEGAGATGIGGSKLNVRDVRFVNVTVSSSNTDANFLDEYSELNSAENVFVGGQSSSDSGNFGATSYTNVHYDNQTTNLNDGNAEGHFTEDLKGSGGISTMNLDSSIWTDTLEYPDLSAFVTALDFQVSSMSTNEPITENETLKVNATIKNEGVESGTVSPELSIDGEVVDDESLTLEPGESKQASFNWSPSYTDSGNKTATVSTPDGSESQNVEIENYDLDPPKAPEIYLPENNTYVEVLPGESHEVFTEGSFLHDVNYDVDVKAKWVVGDTSQHFETYTFEENGNYTVNGTNTVSDSKGYVYFESQNPDGDVTKSEKRYFEVHTVQPPNIDSFSVSPNISDAEVGDLFDLSVDGDVNEHAIDKITYSMDITNNGNPSDIVVDPDFQDQDYFSDSENGAFEMKEAYKGETIELSVTVTDNDGYKDTQSVSATLATPPEGFHLDSPNDGDVFLIPADQTETEVTLDAGVTTAQNSGTAEIILNGNTEKTFNVDAETKKTRTVDKNLTENSYTYKVKFTDDTDGEVYESGSKSFEVTDEPLSLKLDSPSDNKEFIIEEDAKQTVEHKWTVDSRAYSGNYYYKLNVSNQNGTVDTVTSGSISGGSTKTHSETLDVPEGSTTWNVDIYKSSDDTLLEQKSQSYEVNVDPLQEAGFIVPSDGTTIGVDSAPTDVDATFFVETYVSSVDYELLLNDATVKTGTVGSDSYQEITKTLSDLDEGTHDLELRTVDTNDRDVVKNASFEIVVDPDNDTAPTIHTVEFTPPPSEWQVGDEPDVYFEGSGNLSDVDFVQLEITAGGEPVETILVPSEDMQSGSYFGVIDAAFTVTEKMIGKDLGVLGETTTLTGKVTEAFFEWAGIGSDATIDAKALVPEDGEPYRQTPGEVQDIRFEGKIEVINDPVDFDVEVRNSTGDWTIVYSGTKNETDTFEAFVNHNRTVGEQFGEFDWKISAVERNTNEFAASGTNTYNISEADGSPLLQIKEPNDEPYTLDTAKDTATVPFDVTAEVSNPGTLTLDLEGEEIVNEEIESGFFQDSFQEQLEKGTYTATLKFVGQQTATKDVTFNVREQVSACDTTEDIDVKMQTPSLDRERMYQDSGEYLTWSVCGTGEGDTRFEIRDSSGTVVKNVSKRYATQEEIRDFEEFIAVDIPTGAYEFQAFYKQDSGETAETEINNIDVVSFTEPETTMDRVDDVTTEEKINVSWTTESFEEDVEVELRIREKGTYSSDVIYNSGQSDSELRDYQHAEDAGSYDPGEYQVFVRMYTDELEFDSDKQNFVIEEPDIKEPEIETVKPEQDEVFQIENGTNSTAVSFEYYVETFSQSDSKVKLFLQNASVEGSEYEEYRVNKSNINDGEVNHTLDLDLVEAGYRWKVQVEDVNGDKTESEPISFAVNDPETEETPEVPSPKAGIQVFAKLGEFFQDGNESFKGNIGSTGQFFAATIMIVAAAGIAATVNGYLSLIVVLLGSVGFSLADGYYPLTVFWIILAATAMFVGYFGVKGFMGD